MINSVSAVSFKANNMSVQDRINSPGAFTKPAASPQEVAVPKKKGGFLKGLAKLVAAAVIVGGGLLLGFKKGAFKVLDDASKADGIMKKAGHYLGKAGEWVDSKVWQKLPGVAKKAAQAGEAVAEAAEKA